ALDDRLELAVDRELHVALGVGERRIGRNDRAGTARLRGEAQPIAWDELEQAAHVLDRERSCIPCREVFLSRLGLGEIHRGEQWAIGALRQFIALRRLYRAYKLTPVRICDLC